MIADIVLFILIFLFGVLVGIDVTNNRWEKKTEDKDAKDKEL